MLYFAVVVSDIAPHPSLRIAWRIAYCGAQYALLIVASIAFSTITVDDAQVTAFVCIIYYSIPKMKSLTSRDDYCVVSLPYVSKDDCCVVILPNLCFC